MSGRTVSCAVLYGLAAGGLATGGAAQRLQTADFDAALSTGGEGPAIVLRVHTAEGWAEALRAAHPVRVLTERGPVACYLRSAEPIERGLLLQGACREAGDFEQRLTLTSEPDVLDVETRLTAKPGVVLHSVEDRYDFVPARHAVVDERMGPLDFVWSQNIKSEADDLVPTNAWKSPALMLQQAAVFAALLPSLDDRHVETRALDLNVTTEARPWIGFGAIPSTPHGHSYFRRDPAAVLTQLDHTVSYRYALVLNAAPARRGYRRVVRLLWQRSGHPELLRSAEEQRNVLYPETMSFADWRETAWHTDADRFYRSFPCAHGPCGTLTSNRNVIGDWEHTEPDAWFNAWFQTLRTAYGWYVYGRSHHDTVVMGKAESVLNTALTAPQHEGAFPQIYLLNSQTWVPGDGWAGYADSYHAFSMSWTAFWMLRWAEDLVPERKAEILRYVRPYGEFLLREQEPSGVIPSWFLAGTLAPRPELRDVNAETAASALLLATLGQSTGEGRYTAAAERAMAFVEREVVPRERWFDFETFLSCARKEYGFFDSWTAQYPQNNLAEIEAPRAMLALYRATGNRGYLDRGTAMLDYLLLTQQVWSPPQFTPTLLGGFTTQNTDAEWSDARQGYAATLLEEFYEATGQMEYLERAVAAGRSTLSVAPWENWAHTGYRDEPGALTGFHWGTGSAMTSIEMMQPRIGDGLVDLAVGQGVGFNESTIRDVRVSGSEISFRLTTPELEQPYLLHFNGVDPKRTYHVRWNDAAPQTVPGRVLAKDGVRLRPLSKGSQP